MLQAGRRQNVNITYNTSLPVIFGVKKYADALWKVCNERNINVNTRTNLVAIDPDKNEATFQNLDPLEHKTTVDVSIYEISCSTDFIIPYSHTITNK